MTISNRFKIDDLRIPFTTALALMRPVWTMNVVGDHLATCRLPNTVRRTIAPMGDFLIRLDYDDNVQSAVVTATRVAYSGRNYCLCRHTKDVHRAAIRISYAGYIDSLRRLLRSLSRTTMSFSVPEILALFDKNDSLSFYLSESCHNLILDCWQADDGDEDDQATVSSRLSWAGWRDKYAWGRVSRRIETLLRCHNGMERR